MTIIVLLILAGVTIATLTGENGIITKAIEARDETEKASVIEQAKMDILEKQAEKQSGEITKAEFKEILEKYFNSVPEEIPDDLTGIELTVKEEYGGQIIEIAEIWNGKFVEEREYIDTATSYVGYYADIEGDGTVDGIIYADLAVGGSGAWNDEEWSGYEYSAVTSGLKSYYVSQEEYEGAFGKKDVLSPDGSGEDRFYVMALEDVNPGTSYCWYDAANGLLDKIVEYTENDFGEGKENTEYVMNKWDLGTAEGGWGAQNDNGTYDDMWGVIKDQVEEGWFVPSKLEWSAFGDMAVTNLGLTTGNYSTYGLNDWYWSSSQRNANSAYDANFNSGGMGDYYVNYYYYVRLSATF